MNFNKHYNLKDKHAFLSPSSYHWIRYSDEKLSENYIRMLAKEKGTRLHAFAAEAIALGQNLPRSKQTLNMFVNDAIGYKMTPEQILYYSDDCFGTADAICFRKNLLRIHDLKTGETPANMDQLLVYDALFCLEYGIKPGDIEHELRIYQFNDFLVSKPAPEDILPIMGTIKRFSNIISLIKQEE